MTSLRTTRPAALALAAALLIPTTGEAIVVRHADTSTLYQADLAVAYRECTAPNTVNSVGIPACAPAVTSSCSFTGGNVTLRRRNRDATELDLEARVSNVSGPGSCPVGPYTLGLELRITVDDAACTGGSCTLLDLPVSIALLQHNDDFFREDFVLEAALPGPIPALASYEILSAVVVAPDGLPMAAAGVDPDGADVRGNLTVGYAACETPDTANLWSLPACSAPVWTSPCDFGLAKLTMGTKAPTTRMRAAAENLVGAPAECANGTYTFAPRLRITTGDCGTLCTLVDLEQPYPIAVDRGEIVESPFLSAVLPFQLQIGDVLELRGARLLDPFGNLLAALGTTPALRLVRPRIFATFRDPALTTDDKIVLKGRFPYPPLDPTVGGVTVTVSDKDGVAYTATIPAAAWEVRTPGRKWRYKDDLGTIAGIRQAEVRETRFNGSPNGYKIQLNADGVDAGGVDLPAAELVIAASNPDGGTEVATHGTICRVSARRASCK